MASLRANQSFVRDRMPYISGPQKMSRNFYGLSESLRVRQDDVEGDSFAFFRKNTDESVVIADDFLTDRETDSGTFVFISGMQTLKQFKDLVGKLLIESNAIVEIKD